jgi:phosphopantetheinyl transferase (holo-ACP synthase)
VRRDERPTLAFHGRAAERVAELGVTEVWVSLTHSATTAGAMVVIEAAGPLNSRQGTD